jgi:hypothetical protein
MRQTVVAIALQYGATCGPNGELTGTLFPMRALRNRFLPADTITNAERYLNELGKL